VSSPAPSNASWSELTAIYQDNVNASTAILQDYHGPLSSLSLPSPPHSPITHTPLLALLRAVEGELLQRHEQQLERELAELAAATEEFRNPPPEPELQYPIDDDVPAYSPVAYRSPSPRYTPTEDIPVENIPPPVLFAAVATVPSPAPPSRYPTPVFVPEEAPPVALAPAPVQPTSPLFDATLFPHLFDDPPCTGATPHPHQYTIIHQIDQKVWYPQEEFVNRDFLTLIPTVADLDTVNPHFVTPFRGPTPHLAYIKSTGVLPPVTLCSKIGSHPHSLHFPLGYLEISFRDAIKFLFQQFPPDWLEQFEGATVPLVIFDFLDGRRVTVCGKLHFTENGIFVVDRVIRTEDLLRTKPYLFAFVCIPRAPANPLVHVDYSDADTPL
jgi:hypothetical protein